MPKPHEEHRARGPERLKVRLVTVSSSRYEKAKNGEKYTDESGDVAQGDLAKLGHEVTNRELVADDEGMIKREAEKFLAGKADVMIFMGGTGVSTRDITIETVRPFMEKELDGFGELLRRFSYDEIGGAAALTRSTAGVAKGKLIVCLPGSPDAVRLALNKFGKELSHAVYIARN